MSKFLYNKRVLVTTVIAVFIVGGLLDILQHHIVVGSVFIFLALLPAIFLLLQIKMMHGSIFNRETLIFIFTMVMTALLTIAVTTLVEMLYR
jgi:hypothetical protein